MNRAKEILLEEAAKDPNFGLLTGTMPVIERAMERYAKEMMTDFIDRISKNPIDCYSVKNSGQEKQFFLGKNYVERLKKAINHE